MKVKLKICVPTYKRSKNIAQVLETEMEMLQHQAVDICIYDSSPDLETEKIVKKYIEDGYDRLSYERIAPETDGMVKFFHILQGHEKSEYDYIWMIHDHTICNEHAIVELLIALEEGYALYYLNMQGAGSGLHEFANYNEFLYTCAWPLVKFGAVVLSVEKFLKGTDWEKFYSRYLVEKTKCFSQLSLYFGRAAEINDFKACEMNFKREDFLDFMRYEKPSWDGITIQLCTECWGENILGLPEVYTNKDQALQTQDKWFLTKYKLIFYKKAKQYGIKSFFKYGKWFKRMFPSQYWQNLFIAVVPFRVSKYVYSNKLMKAVRQAYIKQQKVYIYGAGRHAMECAAFLSKCEIPFDGFLVTNKENNPQMLMDKNVLEARQCISRENVFIIIAVLTSGVPELKKYLNEIKSDKYLLDYMDFGE